MKVFHSMVKHEKPPSKRCHIRSSLEILALASICITLARQRTARVMIRLQGCAGWSVPFLFANGINRFSHDVAQLSDLMSKHDLDRVKRIWYLSPMRAAKVQASLRIRAVSPEPLLLAHTSSESRGTFRQKARSLAPLNGWECAVKICNDGMLEDTNSLDGAHLRAMWPGITRTFEFGFRS